MRRMILACSVLLTLSTGATAGQIYKWVDAQGNVHFGSQPPEGQEASTVNPNVSQPKPAPMQKPVEAENQGQLEQEKIDQKIKSDIAKREAERQKFCETVRTNLSQMQNNPRIRIEENGVSRRLTEEERQARMAESKKAIEENCE